MTVPEIEITIDTMILGRLVNNKQISWRKRSKENYRTLCPICRAKLEIGDRVIRTNTAKYVHKSCYPLFRIDSDIEVSDEELDDFFIINPDMTSKVRVMHTIIN